MGILVVIGQLLFTALFLVSAYGHLTRRKMMAGYAKSRGVPAAESLVAATGVQMAVGSLMVALGVWPDLGALILFLFLIVTAFGCTPSGRKVNPRTAPWNGCSFTRIWHWPAPHS
ncbi:DoxX family protein [Arthrobacter globiformis]|uniref:DoxX family protein n=1 Tax=Arthrobacter globiformis TaxID=1665 RepID=UPI00278F0D99|nr:DoxX family protein [Arthrobacter globiformis]MDQ0618503.1 putative membrane protein YphA (DoxX/SURF4 family) [Arthrobacter globiformis]